jgi:hypothetical protein
MERLIETLDESKRLNQDEVTTFVDSPFCIGIKSEHSSQLILIIRDEKRGFHDKNAKSAAFSLIAGVLSALDRHLLTVFALFPP